MESVNTGGIRAKVVTQATGTLVTQQFHFEIDCDTSGGNVNITLSNPAFTPGQILFIKKTSAANQVILTPAVGLIDGAASYTLYNNLSSLILQNNGVGWEIIGGIADYGTSNTTTIPAYPIWLKFSVTHTQLQAAALTNNITLFTAPAGFVLHAARVKHSTLFAGTGFTAYGISLGITGELARYTSSFDVFTAVSSTNQQSTQIFDAQDNGATTAIKIAATSAGGNLSASTAGVVQVGLLMSVCTLP
jgi:hypothetical protein